MACPGVGSVVVPAGVGGVVGCCFRCVCEMCCGAMGVVNHIVVHGFTEVMRMKIW